MSDSKMREQFEAWVLSEYPNQHMGKFSDGEYHSNTIQYCWPAWQAARLVPAEDVRAVDEPVEWMHTNIAVKFHVFYNLKQDAAAWTEAPLYRHAQRQMAMPDRRTHVSQHQSDEEIGYSEGWNACIDEFNRLNP